MLSKYVFKECLRNRTDQAEVKVIPEKQVAIRRWLHESFEIKDKLLIEFYDAKYYKRTSYLGKVFIVN